MVDYTTIFHTVPLGGKEMVRTQEGTKTGYTFPKEGWTQFMTTRNTANTPLLAAIAGKDFIGLDFDTDESFNMALKVDSDCKYVAKSDYKGGHMLYRYSEVNFAKSKIPKLLDIQMESTLIFLATPANKTKMLLTEPLHALDDLTVMPLAMQLLVENMLLKHLNENIAFSSSNNSKTLNIFEDSTLGYLLKDIRPDSSYAREIFKIITPKKWRPDKLHPNDIPDGEGTDYLQAIRTRLALDPSINETVFRNTMRWINSLWDNPMPASRIESDCDYQISRATIDGQRAWVYDENWDKQGLIIKDKFNSALEFFYDTKRAQFIEFNRTTKEAIVHASTTNAKHSYLSKKKSVISLNDMLAKANEVEIINSPIDSSFYTPASNPYPAKFNLFVPAQGTQILRDPTLVSSPRYPEKTIEFLKNLIPNETRFEWMLRFIRHKHLTYDYSPIYLVFAGVGGAGKGVFVDVILTYFAGLDRIQDGDLEKLQNNFNAWKITTDYCHIDEAGEGATKREAQLVVAELKKLTGSAYTSVQYKGKDVTGDDTKRQYITPILNTNLGMKVITDVPKNDRRFVYIKCPNKMTVISNGKDSEYVQAMREEMPHFAHYLATQVKPIDIREYTDNRSQKDADYLEFIQDTVEPINLLLEAIEDEDLQKFVNLLAEQFYIPLKDIDSLFSSEIQTSTEARVVFYNTPNTAIVGIMSIMDLATNSGKIDAIQLKKQANRFKKYSTISQDGLIYKYIYLGFKGYYKPFKSPGAIEGAEKLDI